jgi:hypothetical protein
MRYFNLKSFALVLIALTVLIGQGLHSQTKRVFSMNPDALVRAQREAASGNKAVSACVKRLQKDADKVLKMNLVSVMDKAVVAPSGDKHDYLSYGRYWWPDPSKPDGLPYIRRDGETNPEILTITDQENLQQVIKSVHTLGLAHFFTADEMYADRAATILRTWFLNEETRMNPNVNFGQIVKGENVGRASGLIDLRGFSSLVDGVGLLAGSTSWTVDDQKKLVAWFTEYLSWLQTSEIGKKESQTDNNHGVWFDVQRVSIALFVGNINLARSILNDAKQKRIATQIEPDGALPRELARTRSMHYTAFNLQAFTSLALLGDQVGIDLWNYRTPDGRSIRTALDWFLPYYAGEKEWTHTQIDTFNKEPFYSVLLLASRKYGDNKYVETGLRFAGGKAKTDRVNLMYGDY